MRIRPARSGDVDAIAAVWLASALDAYASIFPDDAPKPTHRDLAASVCAGFAHPETHTFVAEHEGDVIGTVTTGAWADEPGTGRLARLYVTPRAWGRGVGAALYDCAERELRDRYAAAKLWVLRRNTRARAMYERRGWELTGATVLTYEPAGIDDVQYRLDL